MKTPSTRQGSLLPVCLPESERHFVSLCDVRVSVSDCLFRGSTPNCGCIKMRYRATSILVCWVSSIGQFDWLTTLSDGTRILTDWHTVRPWVAMHNSNKTPLSPQCKRTSLIRKPHNVQESARNRFKLSCDHCTHLQYFWLVARNEYSARELGFWLVNLTNSISDWLPGMSTRSCWPIRILVLLLSTHSWQPIRNTGGEVDQSES